MIRSDIFPRFAVHMGRIKKNYLSWDRFAVKSNNHKRKIPSNIEAEFRKDILVLLPRNIPVRNVNFSVLSLAELVTGGILTSDVQMSIMNSKNPFLIQFLSDDLSVIFIEELLEVLDEDEMTALFFHDLLYMVLTTTGQNRIRTMFMRFMNSIDVAQESDVNMVVPLLSVHVASSQFRNPYINRQGVTGIDDTIIAMMSDLEIEFYNRAIYKSYPKAADIKRNSELGFVPKAQELASGIVNDILDTDITTAMLYAKLCKEGQLQMYYAALNPVVNMKNGSSSISVAHSSEIINESASLAPNNKKGGGEDMWDINQFLGNLNKAQVAQISDIRYDIDKLTVYVTNIETEDERNTALYRAKCVSNEIHKLYGKNQNAKESEEAYKMNRYLESLSKNVDSLRDRVTNMKISPKRYGVFVEYPPGYEIS